MRLGNFWGLPAPMAVLLFHDSPDMLDGFLARFSEETESVASYDVKKEFLFLAKVLELSEWEAPECGGVEQFYTPDTQIIGGKIIGGSALHSAQLMAEMSVRVMERLIAMERKGDYRRVPDDFQEAVREEAAGRSFTIAEIKRVARKIASSFENANAPSLGGKALEIGFVKKTPKEIWLNGKHVILNEQQTAVWEWYSERLPEIKRHARICSGSTSEEETVFGVSFFDMIKRKPVSIKYAVMNIFQRVKSREFARFLPDCIKECTEEVKKYREGLLKNVDFGNDAADLQLQPSDLSDILSGYSDAGISLLEQATCNSSVDLSDYTKPDVEMLAEISSRVARLEMVGMDNVLGVTVKDYEKFFADCCDIGIYGLNCCSEELFSDAIVNVSLSEKGKIKKSPEELAEIMGNLQDVNALLATLIPIGTELQGTA